METIKNALTIIITLAGIIILVKQALSKELEQ